MLGLFDNKEDDVPEDVLNNKELCLLNSNFYTIDFARTTNGKYIVIETGDGQVSGLPSEKEAELLYTELQHLFWG
ncbi:ATP-grasp domain-containing protein [Hungatella hathewayi]|uniref:ATP-grasp domain-containing protein n=1 Tax=Hungatella hathewayi TaxID=154046 RepID=UPI0015F5A81C|nr:ATP-grasp domain-containing protein [Hungatella hathewayi]